jgi:hypothetical protein
VELTSLLAAPRRWAWTQERPAWPVAQSRQSTCAPATLLDRSSCRRTAPRHALSSSNNSTVCRAALRPSCAARNPACVTASTATPCFSSESASARLVPLPSPRSVRVRALSCSARRRIERRHNGLGVADDAHIERQRCAGRVPWRRARDGASFAHIAEGAQVHVRAPRVVDQSARRPLVVSPSHAQPFANSTACGETRTGLLRHVPRPPGPRRREAANRRASGFVIAPEPAYRRAANLRCRPRKVAS